MAEQKYFLPFIKKQKRAQVYEKEEVVAFRKRSLITKSFDIIQFNTLWICTTQIMGQKETKFEAIGQRSICKAVQAFEHKLKKTMKIHFQIKQD